MPKSNATRIAIKGKTLILIRHAHRDKSLGRERDNGLSAKGKRQAEEVLAYFQKTYPNEMPYVVSSPKLRCVETVMAIAKWARTEVQFSSLLLEQDEAKEESNKAFENRVKEFSNWWMEKGPALTIACSHGDWMPVCLKVLTGARAKLAKGGWAEINLKDLEPSLKWLIQKI